MATTTTETRSPASAEGGPAAVRRRAHLSRPILLLALVAGAILIGLGAAWWRYASARESTDDAFVEATVTQVSARVEGLVAEVRVDDNQQVAAGELLVRLDPRDYQVRVDQVRAAVAVAEHQLAAATEQVRYTEDTTRAQLAQAQAGVRGAAAAEATARDAVVQADARVAARQAALDTARSDAEAAQAALEQARLDFRRTEELAKQGILAGQQFDAARTSLRAAEARANSATARVTEAERDLAAAAAERRSRESGYDTAQIGLRGAAAKSEGARAQVAQAEAALRDTRVRMAQRDLAEAQLAQAKAQLAGAQLNLGYTEIRAATAGRVTRKGIEVGQRISPGQPLFAIVALEDVWIVANFKETQLTHMRPGQPVTIKVDAYPGVSFRGTVDSIQAGTGSRFSLLPPENATGNFVKVVQRVPVKIVLDRPPDPRHVLRPGMSVVPTVRVR